MSRESRRFSKSLRDALVDTRRRAVGRRQEQRPDMNDVLRAHHHGVSPEDEMRLRWRQGREVDGT